MDDYNIHSLNESKNEWCVRLVNVLTYHIIVGFKSIFNESWKLCKLNSEQEKYLMTFQNMISQIPAWNTHLINAEKSRIINNSDCNYLEDLITCVHIIQLKLLTCIRVSQKPKKIELTIPSVETFIHNVYIDVARKLYSNIYLFERNISPLKMQKNNRDFEIIVQNSILNCVRNNIPVNDILKCYLEEQEDTIEEKVPELKKTQISNEAPHETIEDKMKSMLDEQQINENKDKSNEENTVIEDKNSIDGKLEILNEDDTEEEDEEEKGNKEFTLKKDIIESSSVEQEPPIITKSLSFNDTVKAVNVGGEIEEIPMDVIDERRQQREKDLFLGNDDDDDDERININLDTSSQLNLDFETLN